MEVLTILYIVLTASIIILTVLLSLVLVYVLIILRDVNEITNLSRDTAEKVNHFVMQPIKYSKHVIKFMKPLVSAIEKKVTENVQNSTAKAKSKSRKKKSDN